MFNDLSNDFQIQAFSENNTNLFKIYKKSKKQKKIMTNI